MLKNDNFNFTGFIKNNPLLNEAFEGFGGYRDLNPLNEIGEDVLSQDIQKMIAHIKDGEGSIDDDYVEQTWENISDIPFGSVQKQVIGALGKAGLLSSFNQDDDGYFAEAEEGEANAWMSEVDGTEAYTVGEWKCYYDHPGVLVWSYGDIPFEKFSIYATPGWEDPNSTPIQVDIDQDTVDNMSLPQGTFADFGEYAAAMGPALQKIESEYSDDMTDGSSMNELEKPKKISYVTDDSEDEKGFIVPSDDEDTDRYSADSRIFDLGGEQIEQGIISLLDDGFDIEDILEFCKVMIEDHASNKLNESEVDYRIINGKCYRVDDEGNRDEVSMARCR